MSVRTGVGAVACAAAMSLGVASAAVAAPGAWQSAVDLSGRQHSDPAPRVAVDGSGNAVAVWRGLDAGHAVIRAAQRPAGGAWGTPVDVSAPGRRPSNPAIAVDAGGEVTVVWERNSAGGVVIETASGATGGGWRPPVTLSAARAQASLPQVAVDGRGDAVAVWEQHDDAGSAIEAASRPAGAAWSAPTALSVGRRDAGDAAVGIDGRGRATAVWERSDGHHDVVWAASQAGRGRWRPAVTLAPAGQHAAGAQLAVDPRGDVTAVWERIDLVDGVIEAATRSPGGSWQPAVDLTARGDDALDPQVAVDSRGGVTAVWQGYGRGADIVEGASRDRSGRWQTPRTLSVRGPDASGPQLAVDGRGDAVAVWVRAHGDEDNLIQSASRGAGGRWGAAATLSVGGQNADSPQIALDGRGDAVAVWERHSPHGPVVQAAAADVTS